MNVSSQDLMCIWRRNNLEEESIVCLSEVEMDTFLQELLSFE